MKTDPYYTETNEDGQEVLWFQTGDGEEWIGAFHEEYLAAIAARIANEAYNRGRLKELRARKHQLNVDTQKLWEILDSLT